MNASNHNRVPAPLLATKLYIPQARSNLVSRPRLVQRLNTYVERNLTLVSAPAGFGKTTLLSAWHASPSGRAWPLSWLSLDKDDNDPVRFVSYVIAALQKLSPLIGESALVLLHALQSSAAAVSSGGASLRLKEVERFKLILTSLINDVAALAEPCVLVIDDYHVIEERGVHDVLGFLLEHLPPQLHLVVASRSDLPLPLAGLRARGKLHELRADDLRFTVDEAAVFLNQVMGLALSAQDVATLEARTEGWVAGLQLAALSMQGQNDVSSFVKAFAGSHRYVLDYLIEEVLSRQPPRMREFLLDTSVLERLSAPLCQAVTGYEDSREILEQLERANLFVVPLDDQRRWYRYHHLFAEFLRVRLRQRDAERLPDLHRRAARWYGEHGFIVEAVNHALAAEDFEHAAGLVERVARDLLGRSELGMLTNWLNALPAEILEARPRLGAVQAWVLIASAQFDLAEFQIQKLQATDVLPALAGELATIRATASIFQGDWERTADLARQAQELVPEEDEFLRGIVAMDLGIPHLLSGDVRVARQAFAEVARLNQKVGNPLFSVLALCQMAEMQIAGGELHQAADTYKRALQLAEGRDGQPFPVAGMAYAGLGDVLRQWNELEEATRVIQRGIELGEQWSDFTGGLATGAFDGYLFLARVKQAQGEDAEALRIMQDALELAQKLDTMVVDDVFVTLYLVRLWLAQGNLSAVTRWAQEGGLWDDVLPTEIKFQGETVILPYHLLELLHVTLARFFLARDEPERALTLLEHTLPETERLGRWGILIEGLALAALAHHAQDDLPQALDALGRALKLAQPQNYVRLFVDEGEPMARLLSELLKHSCDPDRAASRELTEYVGALLGAFDPALWQATGDARQRPPQLLLEPLSERELEVLQLLSGGLSNREIATRLFLTVGTIKWHLHNIYGKLGVHSRVQAVTRANELDLL